MIQTERIGSNLRIQVPEEWIGLTIDTILSDIWQTPKKMRHLWRMDKAVLVNEQTLPWSHIPTPQDWLSLPVYIPETNDVIPYHLSIEVIYEDDDILIVNKPAGILTHPDSPDHHDTLMNAVSHYFISKQLDAKPRTIHRLDRETSGLIIFTKNAFVTAILDQTLFHRGISRKYQALVHGKVTPTSGTIEKSIGRDRHSNKMLVTSTGQAATTFYQVITYHPKNNTSLIECTLATGRTHQIRVHLSDLGNPIIGDLLYGNPRQNSRLHLHAFQVSFDHPITKKPILCRKNADFFATV